MKIEVWSDFVCPFCYIGKRKLEKAINELGLSDKVEVIYKSYELNPHASLTVTARGPEAFAAVKGIKLEKALELYTQIRERAEEYGLTYNTDKLPQVNTLKAHRLAKWARTYKRENELTELLMDAYFRLGEDLSNNDTLLFFVDKLGLNTSEALEVLTSEKYLDEVKYEKWEARQLDVRGVPFFVFSDRYGIPGAEEDEVFTRTLNQTMEYLANKKTPIIINENNNESKTGEYCGDDGDC